VIVDGLDKKGLVQLSRLIGEELIMRPVGQERIVALEKDDPLMTGIGNHEFYREKRLTKKDAMDARFLHGDLPLKDDVLSSALIMDDVCGLTRWGSIYNGLTAEDHWKYILYYGDGPLKLEWKQPFEIHKVVVRESRHYKRMEEIALVIGDDEQNPLKVEVPREKRPHVFEFEPRKLRSVTLIPSKFKVIKQGPMGWDAVEVYRTLSESFRKKVVPLTRPAGIVKFPMGKGGILLNMMPLGDPLANRVFLQWLHNLGVPRGGKGKGRGIQDGPSIDLDGGDGDDDLGF